MVKIPVYNIEWCKEEINTALTYMDSELHSTIIVNLLAQVLVLKLHPV